MESPPLKITFVVGDGNGKRISLLVHNRVTTGAVVEAETNPLKLFDHLAGFVGRNFRHP